MFGNCVQDSVGCAVIFEVNPEFDPRGRSRALCTFFEWIMMITDTLIITFYAKQLGVRCHCCCTAIGAGRAEERTSGAPGGASRAAEGRTSGTSRRAEKRRSGRSSRSSAFSLRRAHDISDKIHPSPIRPSEYQLIPISNSHPFKSLVQCKISTVGD